jgi:ssDNA thymidine ADP-ribosyltransferase, DarT
VITGRTIEDIIQERGISEILHFTTDAGMLGILETGYVLSRDRVATEKRLEFIFKANASKRKDPQWTDYVNLSISRVNPYFLQYSRVQHSLEEVWWCILSFDPVLLTHPGVIFTTTNNIYWSGIERSQGVDGLEALFRPVVVRYSSLPDAQRTGATPDSWTTCEEAEVLYPGQLSTDFLHRVYIAEQDHVHRVQAWIGTLAETKVDLVLAPEMFSR